MDARLPADAPTAREREVVAAAVPAAERTEADGRVVRGGHAARALRHHLLPALAAVQAELGWVSPGAQAEIARRLAVPAAEVFGVAGFYGLLATEPRPDVVVHLCVDPVCGGPGTIAASLDARDIAWEETSCLGHCDRAPAAFVQRAGAADVEVPAAGAALDPAAASGDHPPTRAVGDRLLARVGAPDPLDLHAYRESDGLVALGLALELGPDRTIARLDDAGLLGRGGAAFPAAAKWRAVRAGAAPRHVVCNADESEPGTFKDRVLLEGDPFAVLEGMAVAGVTVGAEHGVLYLRGEYPRAADRVRRGIGILREEGILGADVLGSGLAFDVELRIGQGAYVCGEETALIASVEGFRGEPRNRPPYPTSRGLFGRPTAVNNVETLASVVAILAGDPRDTKLFPVSGAVAHPGLYEVPLGTTLRELVALSGTDVDGTGPILLGGAAGAFVDDPDLPLSFEAARDRGLSLGSGAVMVFGREADMGDVVSRIAAFFRRETCGQCVPCRVGVVRQEEALTRLLDGDGEAGERLRELDRVMTDASICGLGQTAASAIRSALDLGLVGRAR